jgi:hypothetical protein
MCSRPSLGQLRRRRGIAEVELAQPRLEVLIALGDLVEFVFHRGRELVVDEVGEVVLEEVDDREGAKGRHQGLALLPHVAAAIDRLHHRRVGRRPSDAQVLELLDQRRLGVAIRRLGVVALGLGALDGHEFALGERRQDALLVGQFGLGVVGPLDVGPAKAGELDAQARRAEPDPRPRRAGDPVTVDSNGPCPG